MNSRRFILQPSSLRPGGECRLKHLSGPMSALGQKQTYAVQNGMSALPPKATELVTLCVPMEGRALLLCPVRLNVDKFRQRRQMIGENPIHTARPFPVKQVTRRQKS